MQSTINLTEIKPVLAVNSRLGVSGTGYSHRWWRQ